MSCVLVIDVRRRVTQIPDEFAFRHFVLHVRGCQVDAEHYERITKDEDGVFVQAQVRVARCESDGKREDIKLGLYCCKVESKLSSFH